MSIEGVILADPDLLDRYALTLLAGTADARASATVEEVSTARPIAR